MSLRPLRASADRLGHVMISSLSFRMFMLVFPVCHVLNYEYAENNNKKTTTTQCRVMVSSLSESFRGVII